MVVMKTIFEQLTLDSTLAEGDLVLPSSWERPGTAGLPSDGWKAIYPHLDGAGVTVGVLDLRALVDDGAVRIHDMAAFVGEAKTRLTGSRVGNFVRDILNEWPSHRRTDYCRTCNTVGPCERHEEIAELAVAALRDAGLLP